MLRQDYIGKLTKIRHIAVANDVVRAVHMIDAVLSLEHVHRQRADFTVFNPADQGFRFKKLSPRGVD